MVSERRPVILGPDGKPVTAKKKDLSEETIFRATASIPQHFEDVAANLKPPRLAQILRAAAEDDPSDFFALAQEMEEREPHYASVLATRKRAVSSIVPVVTAASEDARDEEIADAVRTLTESPHFVDMLDDCLDALGKGVSVVEIIWDTSGAQWTPESYIWQDPRHFHFDRLRRRDLRIKVPGDPDGLPLAAGKFITHFPRLKSGIPARSGLARIAAWAFMLKSYSIKDWAAFCETYGVPLRLGKYHTNASEKDKRALYRAILAMANDAAGIVPASTEIEIIQANARGGEAVFRAFADFWDEQISKAVLGQTMTTDDGSSLAQAEVHNDVRLDIRKADARRMAATINRDLVRTFVDLNFGIQERYPAVDLPVTEPEDLKLLAEVLNMLVPMGLRVAMADVRKKVGFTEPDDGAEVLTAPAAVSATEQASPDKAQNTVDGNALMDGIGAEELDAWQKQMAPIVDPVRELIGSASSFKDILAGLNNLAEEMDETELAEALARACEQARVVGDQVN